MSIIDRLFGKRPPKIASQPEQRLPSIDRLPATSATSGDSVSEEIAGQAEAGREDTPIAPEPAGAQTPPLRTLTRYQHDPAYNNFKQRLARAPGQESIRSRNLDYPSRGDSKR
jgi:hypothetical protein